MFKPCLVENIRPHFSHPNNSSSFCTLLFLIYLSISASPFMRLFIRAPRNVSIKSFATVCTTSKLSPFVLITKTVAPFFPGLYICIWASPFSPNSLTSSTFIGFPTGVSFILRQLFFTLNSAPLTIFSFNLLYAVIYFLDLPLKVTP